MSTEDAEPGVFWEKNHINTTRICVPASKTRLNPANQMAIDQIDV